MAPFLRIRSFNDFDVLARIIVISFTVLMFYGNASAAGRGLTFEASSLVGVVANQNTLNKESAVEPITIRADLPSALRVVKIDVSDFVKDQKIDKAFSNTRCFSNILESRYDLVDWLKVTDSNLQHTLWKLYTRSRKILYKISGFYSGNLMSSGGKYILDCFYSDIHLKEEILEENVFSGAMKFLKRKKL